MRSSGVCWDVRGAFVDISPLKIDNYVVAKRREPICQWHRVMGPQLHSCESLKTSQVRHAFKRRMVNDFLRKISAIFISQETTVVALCGKAQPMLDNVLQSTRSAVNIWQYVTAKSAVSRKVWGNNSLFILSYIVHCLRYAWGIMYNSDNG